MPTKTKARPVTKRETKPKMNPINWFEIPASDLKRAMKFYENVLGYSLQQMNVGGLKMAFFPMEGREATGATGSLIENEMYTPSHEGTMIYFSVSDIDGTLKKAEQNGGQTLKPKFSIGEYGFIGFFQDTEGNRVGLHSMK